MAVRTGILRDASIAELSLPTPCDACHLPNGNGPDASKVHCPAWHSHREKLESPPIQPRNDLDGEITF